MSQCNWTWTVGGRDRVVVIITKMLLPSTALVWQMQLDLERCIGMRAGMHTVMCIGMCTVMLIKAGWHAQRHVHRHAHRPAYLKAPDSIFGNFSERPFRCYPPIRSSPRRSPSACPEKLPKIGRRT